MQSSEELWDQSYEDIIGSIPDLIFDVFPSPPRSSPKASCNSPKASCKGPKGPVGKPMRRRSRSSKKAPTTLLTADANNFRALVQQFTGCHSATPLLRAYKGPINLNFKQCNYYPEKPQKQQLVGKFKLHQESFLPLRNFADEDDGECFFSRMGQTQNPRADHALTCDRFDVYDDVWGPEMSGSGDYSTVSYGAVSHEFWGY